MPLTLKCNIHLTASVRDSLGKLIKQCQTIPDFAAVTDDGAGGSDT